MSMVCGLDLHRQQIMFDAMDTASGEVWRGRVWQPDRDRVRRWLRDDVARRANGQPVALAVEGGALVGVMWSRRSRRLGSRRMWPSRRVRRRAGGANVTP